MYNNYKYTMITLCFDVTRRCNMTCEFCARGPAENRDITRDVVDATLDQMQDIFVYDVRLSGGEPLICADMVEYIIDGIIRRNLNVAKMSIFTNATVYNNPQIDKALARAADYLSQKKAELTLPDYEDTVVDKYKLEGRVNIILSDLMHDNANCIPAAKEHYSNLSPIIDCGVQSDSFYVDTDGENVIALYGSAVDNAAKLIPQPVTFDNAPSAHDNNYSFIETVFRPSYPTGLPQITKAITIGVDGTVFPGCMKPYKDVDAESEFNIKDGDLFKYIEDYCWRHPATKGMNRLRRKIKGLQICKEKGLRVDCNLPLNAYLDLINYYEIIHGILHCKAPEAPRLFITIFSLAQLFNEMDNNGIGQSEIQDAINIFADGLTTDISDGLRTRESREKLIVKYTNIYKTLPQLIVNNYKRNITEQVISLLQASPLFDFLTNKKSKIRGGSPQWFEYMRQLLGAQMTFHKLLSRFYSS